MLAGGPPHLGRQPAPHPPIVSALCHRGGGRRPGGGHPSDPAAAAHPWGLVVVRIVWLLSMDGEDPDVVKAATRRVLWAVALLLVLLVAVLVLGIVALLVGWDRGA